MSQQTIEKTVEEAQKEFYGAYYEYLCFAKECVVQTLKREKEQGNLQMQYMDVRMKSPESMTAKLKRQHYPISAASAVSNTTDAVGVRVICRFLDDVYATADAISKQTHWNILLRKDYIAAPKPNGYRSYHIILEVPCAAGFCVPVEVQLRTISQDAWASLEHQMKYKKDVPHQKIIQSELKRCADEMASTDSSMQTIQDLIAQKNITECS